MFCFPSGYRPLLRDAKLRSDHDVTSDSPHFHSFVLTQEDGLRMYGSCLTVFQDVVDVRVPKPGSSTEELVPSTASLPTVICLLSPNPYISSQKEYLLQIMDVAKRGTAFPLEAYLYNIIVDVPNPVPGTSIIVSAPRPVAFVCPSPTELPLLGFSMRQLFSRLSVSSVIKLLNCAMLERRIIVRSSDVELLTMTLECISALMYPFAWPHVYVPVMPRQLLHFLEAPVPYMMGVPADVLPDDQLPSFDEVTFVDLDMGAVFCPDWLPELPDFRKLVGAVQRLVDSPSSTAAAAAPPLALAAGETAGASVSADGTPVKSRRSNSNPALDAPPPGKPQLPTTDATSSANQLVAPSSNRRSRSFINAEMMSQASNALVDPQSAVSLESGMPSGTSSRRSSFLSLASQSSAGLVRVTTPDSGTLPLAQDAKGTPKRSLPFKSGSGEEDDFATSAVRWAIFDFWVVLLLEHESFLIGKGKRGWQPDDVNDVDKCFDKIAFISDQKPDAAPFLSHFLDTQSFANFLTAKLSLLVRQRQISALIEEIRAGNNHQSPDTPSLESQLLALQRQPRDAGEHAVEMFNDHLQTKRSSLGFLQTASFRAHRAASVVASFGAKSTDHVSKSVSETWSTLQRVGGLLGSGMSVPASKASNSQRNSILLSDPPGATSNGLSVASAAVDLQSTASANPTTAALASSAAASLLVFTARSLASIDFSLLPKVPEYASPLQRSLSTNRKNPATLSLASAQASQDKLRGRSLSVLPKASTETEFADASQSAFVDHAIRECEQIVQRLIEISDDERVARLHLLHGHLAGSGVSSAPDSIRSQAMSRLASNSRFANDVAANVSAQETDMRITKLCEIIEHVWSHGVQMNEGKSAFWSYMSQCDLPSGSEAAKNRDRVFKIMLKTDVGFGRCYIRLAIEKRSLRHCLETCLADVRTIKRLYKDYALVLSPEFLSRFLTALNLLNGTDIVAFTSKNYVNCDTGYSLVLHTADSFRAGSSANIFVGMHGSKSSTPRITISASKAFQRGRADEFIIQVADLGIIEAIVVGHDNTGFHPGWLLDRVTVEHLCTGKMYQFECHRWLATDEDDGQIVRTLFERGRAAINNAPHVGEASPSSSANAAHGTPTTVATPAGPGIASTPQQALSASVPAGLLVTPTKRRVSNPPIPQLLIPPSSGNVSQSPAPPVAASGKLPKLLQIRKTGGHVRTPSGTFLGMFGSSSGEPVFPAAPTAAAVAGTPAGSTAQAASTLQVPSTGDSNTHSEHSAPASTTISSSSNNSNSNSTSSPMPAPMARSGSLRKMLVFSSKPSSGASTSSSSSSTLQDSGSLTPLLTPAIPEELSLSLSEVMRAVDQVCGGTRVIRQQKRTSRLDSDSASLSPPSPLSLPIAEDQPTPLPLISSPLAPNPHSRLRSIEQLVRKDFVRALQSALSCGFKSARLFGAPYTLWNFIEKIERAPTTPQLSAEDQASREIVAEKMFFEAVEWITANATGEESDEHPLKFEMLVCTGLRHGVLAAWLQVMAGSATAAKWFDKVAFFRRPEAFSSLVQQAAVIDALRVDAHLAVPLTLVLPPSSTTSTPQGSITDLSALP
ncbi:hypothetical protein, variant [Capsaspora owczarzaki ATCC 30864]|nr:hypothetical protein, variant [Capsaspora owczarzaki ATCC 30864]